MICGISVVSWFRGGRYIREISEDKEADVDTLTRGAQDHGEIFESLAFFREIVRCISG